MSTERLFGIETEYAIVPGAAIDDPRRSDRFVWQMMQQAEELLPSIGDAGGRGRFLSNGSRFYIDCGHHPEWSTAELANPWDAVRHVLAGERWLLRLAESMSEPGERPVVSLFKTNVDPMTRVAWGCHESVLFEHTSAGQLTASLIPLLVTRVVYTGAGGFDPFAPGLEFVISPRAMFLQRVTSQESTWNRAIVHTKHEPLCGHGFKRWHLICGESLNSEIAMWLRSATLVLGVSLVEGGVDLGQAVRLAFPVDALHALVRDPTCRLPLATECGSPMTPLQIQRYYLEQAEAHARADFMPPWAGTACRYWRAMLDELDSAPDYVATTLDWAIKRALFTRLLERRGLDWDRIQRWNQLLRVLEQTLQAREVIDQPLDPAVLVDPPESIRAAMAGEEPLLAQLGIEWAGIEAFVRVRRELFEADARFSEIGDAGLFACMDREGVLTHHVAGVDNIEHAMQYPPTVGRARIRGAAIRRVQAVKQHFLGSWGSISNLLEQTRLDLSHPFETEERWKGSEAPSGPPQQVSEPPGAPIDDDPPFAIPADDPPLAVPADAPPFARRAHALDLLLQGDYDQAEALLDGLVREGFDLASTLCHAARLAIVRSDPGLARALVEEAWSLRMSASPYAVGRMLWFRALFAMLAGQDPRPWLGRLKHFLLCSTDRTEWIMGPVLERVRAQLPADCSALLAALVDHLSAEIDNDALDQFPVWREAGPVLYRAADPADARHNDLVA